MTFRRKDKGKKLKTWLFVLFCLFFVIPGIGFFLITYEGENPAVNMDRISATNPAKVGFTGVISDRKSGIKKIRISILKGSKESILLDNSYPQQGVFHNNNQKRVPVKVAVDARKLGISDGPAKLKVAVWDHSWRNWWEGNHTVIEKELIFDTKSPTISILSSQHNVSQGGAGLVIYRLSETCARSGVIVGDEFFPGYAGHYESQDVYIAFFALGFNHHPDIGLFVQAVDSAGNASQKGFYHYIRKKSFKSDTINISDHFLNWKLPEFQGTAGLTEEMTLLEQFIFINSKLRKKNNSTILANGKKTENQLFWDGAFTRLPNSARRANFADHRTYLHNGKQVSQAVHMGIDLASIKHAQIPAGNHGKIVFAGPVGIYGNVVCIDHGFGLISIYAHLSRMSVQPDDMVSKGDIIGYTGITGLAGGDHLHYAVFIDHVFVNPIEWWDLSWINNNIISKLESVQ